MYVADEHIFAQWSTEQVALIITATMIFQVDLLLICLDALGNDIHIKILTKLDDGINDTCWPVIRVDVHHERPVNFQLIYRQFL